MHPCFSQNNFDNNKKSLLTKPIYYEKTPQFFNRECKFEHINTPKQHDKWRYTYMNICKGVYLYVSNNNKMLFKTKEKIHKYS